MREIYIIGTLHAGLTPNHDIAKLLAKYQPDQLLVEITEDDIIKSDFYGYPPEMVSAYSWAREQGVLVNGFDADIEVMKKDKTEADNIQVVDEAKELMTKFSWQDMNRPEVMAKTKTKAYLDLIDWRKFHRREAMMLKNIKSKLLARGRIVILTGAAHLDYLAENLPEAKLPLRQNS